MTFRISGLAVDPFRHLIGLPDDLLKQQGVIRYAVDRHPGYPDRISLDDARVGQTVLLINFEHQPASTPYRARHAIFISEQASQPFDAVDEVPPSLRSRMLSLRAFDTDHMMIEAELIAGQEIERALERLLGRPAVSYVQAHYAQRGCYAARVERA